MLTYGQQTRHLRERLGPEPDLSDRGAGLYLPEDLIGYTISSLEVAQRGDLPAQLVDRIPESTFRMVRASGLVTNLTRLAALHFESRTDEGRDAMPVRQATGILVVRRLLPKWSRTSL